MNLRRYSSFRFPFTASSVLLSLTVLASVIHCGSVWAQSPDPDSLSKTTEAKSAQSRLTEGRLTDSGWWPTKGGEPRDEYVGATQCGACHDSQFKDAQNTAMAHAAIRARDSSSIRQHSAPLNFEIGPYSYRIRSVGEKSTLSVSEGSSTRSQNLLWAFGVGRIAQTYVYEQKGSFYESHVSFYTALQALDVTPGHPRGLPPNLEEAAGRLMPAKETRRCFGCHTTASNTNTGFDPRTSIPGVSCEACHGPGAKHVAAIKSGNFDLALESIVNPAKLTPSESVDFCGACHRTLQDVAFDSPTRTGALNIRFAPYRLENSRCWKEGKGDARITCLTCHDPHQPLATDPASYDATCLKCHDAAGAGRATKPGSDDHASEIPPAAGRAHQDRASEDQPSRDHRTACPIGVQLCVTCHMPKFTNTGFHFTFTDHWIRIADAGAPLPD